MFMPSFRSVSAIPLRSLFPLRSPRWPYLFRICSAKRLAHATICSYISALTYVHKLRGLADPTKSFLISNLLTAQRRANPQLDVRLPITRSVLHSLVRSLEFTSSSAYQRLLYSAMFLSALYGFFRVGELTSKSARAEAPVVHFDQLTFSLEAGTPVVAKITIRQYKHNQSQRPFDVLIKRATSQPFCPVHALLQFCTLRGRAPGTLFCMPDFTNFCQSSIKNFALRYLFVVSTRLVTKLTGFESGPLAMQRQLVFGRSYTLSWTLEI